ncbi:hypothetical protein INT44_001082 [Umbelopsis vinacea]|uniref:Aminoacyl-transfer RNA synthetases class-II family profile domain-containing protein n=1 Tax=Umbelopsis vinacea TaxID=44442 RepID=A0A8H7QAM1_9FUNG|nr:hypothetical protein INT44_001082 [Umbelopsis vinacea]
MAQAQRFRALLDLCKRRGFLFQSAEIHGGLRGAYDYGPLGVELKKNIAQSWWRRNVYFRDNVVGIDTSIVTPHNVLKASGHVDEFTDALVDCLLTKERFRPDKAPPINFKQDKGQSSGKISIHSPDKETAKLWEQKIQNELAPGAVVTRQGKEVLLHVKEMTTTTYGKQSGSIVLETTSGSNLTIPYHGYAEPATNSPFLTDERPFNLMFKTFLDPIDPIDRVIKTTIENNTSDARTIRDQVDNVLRPSTVYLRPETAQGVFINFNQVMRTMKTKLPFGIAQMGKSFRNEIRLEHAIFRTPEFEQLELEYFTAPWESSAWFQYWQKDRLAWWLEHANNKGDIRTRNHEADEMAHYAKGCMDVEYKFPWGWGEVEGVANRGNYDLTQHMKATGENFEVLEDKPDVSSHLKETALVTSVPQEPTRFVPTVIESSCGLNRALLAFLCDAFQQVQEPGKESRTVLKLHPRFAPVKCAIMPLTGNAEFQPYVEKVARSLRRQGLYTVIEAQKLRIGKRYYRHDEIGTPFCITVDHQTLEDQTVTIRDRDTAEQHRIPITDVSSIINEKIWGDEAPELD